MSSALSSEIDIAARQRHAAAVARAETKQRRAALATGLPESPAAMPRPGFLVWCVIRAHGPIVHAEMLRLLSLEQGMPEKVAEKAIKVATGAAWVRLNAKQAYEHVPREERP